MEFSFEDQQITRRLPVYLLLDVSTTMAGSPIESVNQGMQLLYQELFSTPQAIESAWLSVITFGSRAEVKIPLTPLTEFQPPHVQAGGATVLGAAIQLVIESIDRDVVTHSGDHGRGDYRPLLFILTDGKPSDDWETTVRKLRNHPYRPASIIVLGCGDSVQTSVLHQIGDTVLLMTEVTAERILAFFQWISRSVDVASKKSIDLASISSIVAPPDGTEQV